MTADTASPAPSTTVQYNQQVVASHRVLYLELGLDHLGRVQDIGVSHTRLILQKSQRELGVYKSSDVKELSLPTPTHLRLAVGGDHGIALLALLHARLGVTQVLEWHHDVSEVQ